MKNDVKEKLIDFINYKDVLIILGTWYLMASILLITRELTLDHIILTDIFHFLFIVSGRFIYFSLIVFYLTSLYSVEFKDLGLRLNNIKEQIKISFPKISLLFVIVLLLINIPASFTDDISLPALFKITGPNSFISSIFPLILLFLSCLFISLSEQFILNVVIFELFNNTFFKYFLSLVLTALLYSLILGTLMPSKILINFIAALISIILYRSKNSIIPSSLFIAAYYSIFIAYIYGWQFIKF